jgi:4-hydroxybenzoate polyprenyltransferase
MFIFIISHCTKISRNRAKLMSNEVLPLGLLVVLLFGSTALVLVLVLVLVLTSNEALTATYSLK